MKTLLVAASTLVLAAGAVMADKSFTIRNYSGEAIMFVYITDDGDDWWGPDELCVTCVIRDGSSKRWTIPDSYGCLIDVKAESMNDEWFRFGLDLCKYDTWTLR